MHKTVCTLLCFMGLLLPSGITAQDSNRNQDSLQAARLFLLARENTYSNPLLGKKYSKESIRYAKLANQQLIEAWGYNYLGLCHRNMSEYDSAIAAFEKASTLHRLKNELGGKGQTDNNAAITWYYKGEYEKSNRLLLEVIKNAEEHKLYPVLANAYQNLGLINESQDRYRDALENFVLAEKYHDMTNNVRGKSGAVLNQAVIYSKHLKQYDKAIVLYNKLIPIKQGIKDDKGVGICYNNIAETYLNKKDYTNALLNINKAIPIRVRLNDQHGLSFSYSIISKIYLAQEKYGEAEKYARLAAAIAKKIEAKKEYADALRLLSTVQGKNNESTEAYENLVNSVKIKDSLLNKENFLRMAELETKYATERKEREILAQRTKIAENQLMIDQQNMIILSVCAIALIAILIGFVVYNRQKIKTIRLEKEAELKDALLLIETQNKLQEQRLRISRDLHDNIGSQLTFIISSLDNLKYSFDIANEGLKERIHGVRNFTKDTITELRDTIWAMNKEGISLLDLKTRISNFIENAKAASQGIQFRFEIDASVPDSASFSSLKGINLYRVIQESINNALKHAGATEVAVTISAGDSGYIIKITDNGCGFDSENISPGNGLANIKKRVADSGGQLALGTSPGEGTEIIIRIK